MNIQTREKKMDEEIFSPTFRQCSTVLTIATSGPAFYTSHLLIWQQPVRKFINRLVAMGLSTGKQEKNTIQYPCQGVSYILNLTISSF
jgi:hypothetical protein